MKKILIILSVITITGCINKKQITTQEFIKKLEEKEYTTQSIKEELNEYDYIKEATLAQKQNIQIEFYELTDENYAQKFYDNKKNKLLDSCENKNKYLNKHNANYSKFSETCEKNYQSISRIENTIIYLDIDKTYKEEIKTLLKDLGY